MDKSKEAGLHSEAQRGKRKSTTAMRKLHRRLKEKGIVAPPVDKMVREPERKKEVWELLAGRERDIQSGQRPY